MMRGFRFLLVIVVIGLLVGLPGYAHARLPRQQDDLARQRAQALLSRMTPEERVGQLFIVTLPGTTFDETSQIYDLIAAHHVGGVMISRSNDNITSLDNAPTLVYSLIRQLQQSEWNAAQRSGNINPVVQARPQYIPLLIGISQEGDDYPNDQILNGLTQMPNLMSIGATWDPEMAEQVGAVVGEELSALGFNLFIGPALDVLDTQTTDTGEDLGVRSFGGSPYWVGKMGQAYISGLHQGSASRMLVIAKHFPGRGSSDRSPDEEVATVRKSLEDLMALDLAPFFAVTGSASNPSMAADGLLVSHIRYQGFQGNIRTTTRPVSSDSAALEQVLQLPVLRQWHDQGGLMVSDNLGSQAVRRFYDPTGSAFDARTAAREAFFAGNDLLYVDQLVAANDPDSYTTIVRTLEFFTQKYREDAAFAQRVDASVERILTAKYRLYPEFNLATVHAPDSGLVDIGQSQPVTFDIARRSVTLISPEIAELDNTLARPPEPRERIVFLTDVQVGRQCSSCVDQVPLPVDILETTVMRLYGPRAGGQISQNLLSSYSFLELQKLLNGTDQPEEEKPSLENDLKLTDWVVVSMLKPDPAFPETLAFRRLLSERPDLLRNKKVVVFAFNAPYYLDATDISKLSAYYGMYSKTPAFVDVAARILFQELVPAGALPVSVPGIGYNLSSATAPEPTQVIPLIIDSVPDVAQTAVSTQEPTPVPVFRVGDIIPLRTGVIYDYNRNQVPDGTPVRFHLSVISESSGSTQQQIDTETMDGVARFMYRIERPGLLEIHASTDTAARTNLIRLDITSGVSAGITVVAPTPQPTETMVPTPTITVTITPTSTQTPVPPVSMHFQDWFLSLFLALGSAAAVAYLGIRYAVARWGMRWALCGVIGGMLAYNYLAFRLPGSEALLRTSGTRGVLLATLVGVLLGWIIGLLWRQFTGPVPRSLSDRQAGGSVTGPKSQSG